MSKRPADASATEEASSHKRHRSDDAGPTVGSVAPTPSSPSPSPSTTTIAPALLDVYALMAVPVLGTIAERLPQGSQQPTCRWTIHAPVTLLHDESLELASGVLVPLQQWIDPSALDEWLGTAWYRQEYNRHLPSECWNPFCKNHVTTTYLTHVRLVTKPVTRIANDAVRQRVTALVLQGKVALQTYAD